MPDGLLICDKPAGPTSHDCVARCRRIFGQKKIGHAGTLDPMATGVLVLALGRATRLLEYHSGADKCYVAEVVFGESTDSDDADGLTTAVADASALTAEALSAALPALRGEILQVPPAVSAKKVGGRRLHELYRRGERPEIEPCRVLVHRLELTAFARGERARATLEVTCGAGTYVRAIARDLGRALGVGAHLTALRRTAAGGFTLADAAGFEAIEEHREVLLLPAAAAVAHLPRAVTARRDKVVWGQPLADDEWSGPDGGPIALFDGAGELLAVGTAEAGSFRVRKVFCAPAGGGSGPAAIESEARP